jgi:CheY-like chemotaxis protein
MSSSANTKVDPSWDSTPDTEPYRILIAEDAADSQLILRAYLKEFSCDLKMVSNGTQAVDEFRSAPYDMVLMDIQMPEMDGLTATRQIRSIEQECGTGAVPIVALTASSDQEDKEACLRAGCNACCSKPVTRAQLIDIITQYYQRPGRTILDEAALNARAQDGPLEANVRQVSPAGIEDPAEPIICTPPAVLKSIAPGYLANRRNELPLLLSFLASSNWDQLRMLGHRMKGSGTPYGCPELTKIGAAIEKAAKIPDADALAAELRKLGDYLSRVRLSVA